MVKVDNEFKEMFGVKLQQCKAAQRTARAHIADEDSARFDAAMREAEQCICDMERMVQ